MVYPSLSDVQRHRVADTWDTLSLLGGGGGEQSAGAAEQDAFPAASGHTIEEHPRQHYR